MKRQHKTLIAICLVALVLRLLALNVLLPKMISDIDLDSYRSLAQNLAAGHGFVASTTEGRTLPNVSRTPAYPLFLASLIRLGGDRLGLFLIAQCVLGTATCLLTMFLAARWLSGRCAMVAGALLALDPNSVVRCADLRTETLFTLLLISGVCLLAWRNRCWWSWMLTGFVWSLSALCRPIAVWLWLVAGAAILIRRERFVYFLVFLVGYLPLQGLWAARNHALTGRAFISTISTFNLLMYRAASIVSERTGQPLGIVQRKFQEEFGDVQFFENRVSFESSLRNYRAEAARVLLSARAIALKQTIAGWGKVLFGPGARGLDNMLKQPGTASRWWPPLYAVALFVVFALNFVGIFRLGREAALLSVVALYFVLLAGGPEGNSRFRVPVTPVLAVLAVAGVCGSENKE